MERDPGYYLEEVKNLVFSIDGSRCGYVVRKSNGKCVAVIDGKESKEYMTVWGIVPGKNRFGFVANDGGKWKLVVDGNESKEYEELYIPKNSPSWYIWSSDYKLLAFVGRYVDHLTSESRCEVGINGHSLRTISCRADFYLNKNTIKFIEVSSNKIYKTTCREK